MRISHLAILTYALIGADSSDEGQAPATVNVAPAAVVQVPSPSLNESRSVTVLLPTDYVQSGKRYLVLYLLHGGGQDHTAFAARSWFAAQASQGMIIVTPNAGESWYVNSVIQPKAKYEDFVVKDLVSYIDAHYRTLASREGRAVAGVSMGGWGAMLLGLKHPDLFRAVGALSAPYLISRQSPNMDMTSREQQTFGAPGSPERLARDPVAVLAAIPLESVPLLYLASGNQDIFVVDNRRFVERLTERKIPYEYREISPRGHSWDLWDGQLVSFIELLAGTWNQPARSISVDCLAHLPEELKAPNYSFPVLYGPAANRPIDQAAQDCGNKRKDWPCSIELSSLRFSSALFHFTQQAAARIRLRHPRLQLPEHGRGVSTTALSDRVRSESPSISREDH